MRTLRSLPCKPAIDEVLDVFFSDDNSRYARMRIISFNRQIAKCKLLE